MAELKEENQRVVILFVGLIPDHMFVLPCQFGEGGALAIPRFCLQDGQAIIQRLFENSIHPRTRQGAGIARRWY